MKLTLFIPLILFSQLCIADVCEFSSIDSSGASKDFKDIMKHALQELNESETNVGRLSYQSICSKRVKIGSLKELTQSDYLQVLSDFKRYRTQTFLKPKHFKNLKKKDSKTLKELERILDGYMWEDRIYLKITNDFYQLAATLVHEINHVLNRSEISYYESPENAFMEEYRAFFIEELFHQNDVSDESTLRDLQQRIATDYNLDVDFYKLPLIPTGLLLPSSQNWTKHWPH